MPGVEVITATRVGPTAPLAAASGQFFVSGITERGDTSKAILLRGVPDMQKYLGTRQSYSATVWDCVKTFFDEGGAQCYVSRVVGPAASVGTLTLVDRAGSPVNTLRADAQNAGAWSANLTIQVQNGSVANSFRLTVRLSGVIVQDVNNLLTPAAAVNAFASSPYVRFTDLASATAAPSNIPAVLAATPLSAGADDRAAVTATTVTTGLDKFNYELGDGAVACPGYSTQAVWVAINAHCVANRRIGLLAAARGDSKATLLGRTADLDSEYCGLFAPWVRISDGVGGYVAISPEGYVAACRARAHQVAGPWRVPAGNIAVSSTLLDVDTVFTQQDSKDLDDGRVSVIRNMSGTNRLYGWRSLSSDTANYSYLKDRDTLNWFVTKCSEALENYVFDTVDARGHLLSQVNAAIVGVADPVRVAGGLYELFDSVTGRQIDPGYKVVTDSSVNTPESLATNVVNVVLLVRLSPTSGLIRLTIVKVGLLSGL